MANSPEEHHFHQHDAIKSGIKGSLVGGGAGLITSAVQNSLAKRNVGAFGVFTRTGGTVAMFTALGAVYLFSKDAAANLREKDDTLNVTIASFLGGATIGLRTGRMPQILGIGAAFSAIMSAFEFTGGTLRGKPRTEAPEIDEYDRKEYLRKNRRRPIAETISEIGEGRGTNTTHTHTHTPPHDNVNSSSSIEPPGYEERRRERLKEKYGYDIKPVSANVE
ncbi:NADH-ubiquinone oxidoreductase 213 kDa subunit [Hypoxylon rubiginosum]|uniref:NADH-ubiquinone oxidoreductase 213 kDa subunit n=1 Tax=Hypoxylon rubiginosum TaxID=110542 RepID=A0ACB9YH89_9PEZI|nr:NADH-ubiquinone oxidoreductase 213 kDa subunit [Hypoxylon rubiginosum]